MRRMSEVVLLMLELLPLSRSLADGRCIAAERFVSEEEAYVFRDSRWESLTSASIDGGAMHFQTSGKS
jgi:hypothetical protein